jgi:putative heme d1 biosynthesis radical SAM protein NirJ2
MIISWNTTKACNLKCKHCYRDAGKIDPAELNTQEARDLIGEIANAGFKIVILSGGEPLIRKDIYELIKFCVSFGLKAVLGTNGTLITKLVAYKLKEAGIARVGISLDSADSKIHDAFRQKIGVWKATVKAMQICKDIGLEFQVHTTVSKQNFKELEKITDFVEEMGACAHHIFFLVPTGRGKEINDFLLLPKDYKALLYKILQKQQKTKLELKPVCAPQFIALAENLGLNIRFRRGCLAGISYCCILPNGDVHPCPYLPLRIGNVREKRFSQLWKENEIFIKLRSLDYKGKCADCSSKDTCGGCRARAFYIFGDYMAEDPMCPFVSVLTEKC